MNDFLWTVMTSLVSFFHQTRHRFVKLFNVSYKIEESFETQTSLLKSTDDILIIVPVYMNIVSWVKVI